MAPTLSLLRELLKPGYQGIEARGFHVPVGNRKVRVLSSGTRRTGKTLLFSTGFASRLSDYEPLVKLFEEQYRVVRVVHPGSTRWDGLRAFLRLLWYRGRGKREAARRARRWIHRESNCQSRLEDLLAVHDFLSDGSEISLAGHSFGTDTALRFAALREVKELFLFSPHPPGYLLPLELYGRVKARMSWVITGTRDYTRDGVGPRERLEAVAALGDSARVVILEQVGHMDFALPGLGPPDWVGELRRALEGE